MSQETNSNSITVVLGIGVSGLSVARFLKGRSDPFVMGDTRLLPPLLAQCEEEFPGVNYFLGADLEQVLTFATQIVVSPGLAPAHPVLVRARELGIEVIGDIELFARHVNAPVVAITGANGKSTVTELLGEMARVAGRQVAVGGNLGTPALSLLADSCDLYVLELSSFQLELVSSLQPAIATILNISADHLDRYPSMVEYCAAKQRIFHNAQQILVNLDDKQTYPHTDLGVNRLEFGLAEPSGDGFGVELVGGVHRLVGPAGLSFPVRDMSLQGRHNWANALAALALGYAVGLPMPAMLTALRKFNGLAHRCQFVATLDEVNYINDSKATNVGSALAAIEGLGNEVHAHLIWIAGGVGKGAEFGELKVAVAHYVKRALLLGEDADKLAATLQADTVVETVPTLEIAVQRARDVAEPGDVVLLSPACASFDMFKNFEVRGECFQSAVKALQ